MPCSIGHNVGNFYQKVAKLGSENSVACWGNQTRGLIIAIDVFFHQTKLTPFCGKISLYHKTIGTPIKN